MSKFISINCAWKDQVKGTLFSKEKVNFSILLKKYFLVILLCGQGKQFMLFQYDSS